MNNRLRVLYFVGSCLSLDDHPGFREEVIRQFAEAEADKTSPFVEQFKIKLKIANALNTLRRYADIDLMVHTKPMYEQFILLNSGFKKEIISSGTVIYEAKKSCNFEIRN